MLLRLGGNIIITIKVKQFMTMYVFVVQQNCSCPLVRCECALVYEIVALLILNWGTTLASASPTDLFNFGRGHRPRYWVCTMFGQEVSEKRKIVY